MKHALMITLALALFLAVTDSTPESHVTAAWPRLIMFYGGVLERPVYLTDHAEVMRFMDAVLTSTATARDMVANRPHFEVALYWHNPTWEPYAGDTALLKTLPLPSIPWSGLRPPPRALGPFESFPPENRPRLVQPARLYLGNDEHPPLFDYFSAGANAGLRMIAASGLDILRNHAVPTHESPRDN